jgi:hypothetical protein
MGEITYFVALPFARTEDGDLVAGEALECQSAFRAVREAERLARKHAGAVAFSRSGDPSIGEFSDAEVIKRFGDLPSELFQNVT